MQKKEILLCLLLALIFLSFVFGFWLFKRHVAAKQGQLHVFVEFTTNGALLEMVELVKLPADMPKIIAWGRFGNVSERIDLSKYNAREIKCNTGDIVREVKKELRKHPNYKIVFYTTVDHAGVSLYPVLDEIPPKNVAHIHLFEEGHGALAVHKKAYHLAHDYEFDNCPDNPIMPAYAYYTHLKYPTTYHLGFVPYMKKRPEFQKLMTLLRHADVQNVDFYEIADNLTSADKKEIAAFVGFNPDEWRALIDKAQKPAAVLVGSWFRGDRENADLYDQLAAALSDTTYFWLYKPHPGSAGNDITDKLQKQFPDLVVIPSGIPLESFLFEGILPEKMGGVSSSVFLSLPRSRILFYIEKQDGDSYLPYLIEEGLITKDKVIRLPQSR